MQNVKKTMLFMALIASAYQLNVFAALQGTGTKDDPICGNTEIEAGDLIYDEQWLHNLTEQNNRLITLNALYAPNTYELIFDANGGIFSDQSTGKELSVIYNDGTMVFDPENGDLKENDQFITLPETPEKENHTFVGWYLRGNQIPKEDPGEQDGELIQDGSRYMIANDDADDMKLTSNRDGKPVAYALWRSSEVMDPDGNGTDEGVTPPDDQTEDLWDMKHYNNHVIEMVDGLSTKEEYRRKHGKTAYNYGRVVFDAGTDFATDYAWSHKDPGASSYQEIDNVNTSTYTASGISREQSGETYRCVVDIGTAGYHVSYETELEVYYLPTIGEAEILVNGAELQEESV